MKRTTLTVGVVLVASLAGAGWITLAAQNKTAEAETWPPQFPRPGATKVFENDKVIIWDEFIGSEPYFHRHVRDVIAVRLEDGGGVSVRTPDGAQSTGNAAALETRGPGTSGPRFSSYSKAGLGPHAEVSVDPNRKRHNLWIELKGTEPQGLLNGRWRK